MDIAFTKSANVGRLSSNSPNVGKTLTPELAMRVATKRKLAIARVLRPLGMAALTRKQAESDWQKAGVWSDCTSYCWRSYARSASSISPEQPSIHRRCEPLGRAKNWSEPHGSLATRFQASHPRRCNASPSRTHAWLQLSLSSHSLRTSSRHSRSVPQTRLLSRLLEHLQAR